MPTKSKKISHIGIWRAQWQFSEQMSCCNIHRELYLLKKHTLYQRGRDVLVDQKRYCCVLP